MMRSQQAAGYKVQMHQVSAGLFHLDFCFTGKFNTLHSSGTAGSITDRLIITVNIPFHVKVITLHLVLAVKLCRALDSGPCDKNDLL